MLGDRILQANERILSTTDSVKLFTGALTIETPRKADLSWPADLGKYTSTTKNGINLVKLPVRFLKINDDVAIWSAPLELFCELSNEVRERSPFECTFYFGNTNGWPGYLPSQEQWKYGGYEVGTVSPYTESTGRELMENVTGYLPGEMKSVPTGRQKTKKR
ncbi:MAG: hypothetical protein ABI691_25335 [Ginsengibacter sp.]